MLQRGERRIEVTLHGFAERKKLQPYRVDFVICTPDENLARYRKAESTAVEKRDNPRINCDVLF